MSEDVQLLSPIKFKKSYKNLNFHLSINSPINEELPKIKKSRIRRRSTEILRNNLHLKIKTEEEKEKEQRLKTKLFRQSAPCDFCIDALKINPNNRTEQQIRIISYYLQTMKNFMNIFKDQIQNEELDEFLNNISSFLNYEHIPKNKFIFKYADKAEKFYIILKGKVEFCVPKENKILMNEEEYILFLIKLRFNEEIGLIKKNMDNNKLSFNYGDNFDQFVLRTLKKHVEDKENIYSDEIYLCFKKIKELFIDKKNKSDNKEIDTDKINTDNITIKQYLQKTSFTEDIIPKNDNNINISEKRKVLLNIFQYEKTNTYEDGDCFGLSSSKSKNPKRSTTAISTENCDLAVLDKNLYDKTLDIITKKAKEKIYKLVMSHKMFNTMSKHIFNSKYYHMFRFTRFYLNNIIMDETKTFDKIIIFTSGEFILSVNKNIFELNDLIMKIKKIQGSFYNYSDKRINNDLNEKKENEELENTKNYASHSINEYITKKQNLIISTINDQMILGYPDTIDKENNLPFFNCKCISTSATGYVVEKEMIKLFKRDGYLRTTPPQIAKQKINFYLRRLLEHKKNILNRIEFLEEQDKKIGKTNISKHHNINKSENNDNNNQDNVISDEYNNLNKIKEDVEKSDELLNITRNNLNPINLKYNNIFEFQLKKISNQIYPSYLRNKEKINLKDRHIHLIEPKNEKENFIDSLNRYEQEIQKKKYLLRLSQQKSPKFKLKEKIEFKQFQMNLNKYDTKRNYNDISNIFSKEPSKKKSVLDKFRKKYEDNVLDPKIHSLKRQINYEKLNLYLPNANKSSKINTNINTRNNTNNNLDIRNKYILTSPKSETINNISNSNINKRIRGRNKKMQLNYINNSEMKNIKIKYNNLSLDDDIINDEINLNKLNKTKFNNLYNELYTNYIYTQLNEDNKSKNNTLNNNYQKMDNYKLNKIQLNKIKHNIISPEIKKDKKEISFVDPLSYGNFVDNYNKQKFI